MNWNVNKHDGRTYYLRWGGGSQVGNTEQLAQFFSHSKANTTLGLSFYETYIWTSLEIFLVLSSTFFTEILIGVIEGNGDVQHDIVEL